jgi:glycosyltransferase involved in cell wall biosynthesis
MGMSDTAGRADGYRVLQILPALGEGGVERDTIDLAGYLARQGWTPIVASRGGRGEAELRALGVTTRRMPLHAKSPLVIRANIRRLQALVQELGVQLIHARSRAAAWSGYYAARRCNIPFVTSFHGLYSGSERFFKHRYNRIMARGDRVIAVSEHVGCHLRERYGVEAARLRVIPSGIDLDRFAAAAVGRERIAPLARRWRLEGQGPRTRVLMLPGRLTPIKGHLLLLEAIGQMERRNLTCLLVGTVSRQSRYAREIESQIAARGLAEVVRLVGGCTDMPAALALADVVVAPSIGPEALGRVTLEAQAMGKPVVATDIGGLGETVMPASTGWLVPPGDPAALARALELALAMPDDARARLAVRARRLVERRFGVEAMAASTLAVYRELLPAPAPGQGAGLSGSFTP